MAIQAGHKSNFNTLLKAAGSNDLALMECDDRATGKKVAVVCAVYVTDGVYTFVPIAKLFDGNPYEELNPPTK